MTFFEMIKEHAVYTKRKIISRNKTTDKFVYEFNANIKSRILMYIFDLLGNERHAYVYNPTFDDFLNEVNVKFLQTYGSYLYKSKDTRWQIRIQEQFANADTEHSIDFIELIFRCKSVWSIQKNRNEILNLINAVLETENIGYFCTPYIIKPGGMDVESFPKVKKIEDKTITQEIYTPLFNLLSDPVWINVDKELSDAFDLYRKGHIDASNNACGRALESTIKIICDKKGWNNNSNDKFAHNVDLCKSNNLFESFHAGILTSNGAIRNALGSHGNGSEKSLNNKTYAKHMVNLTCSNILLLIELYYKK